MPRLLALDLDPRELRLMVVNRQAAQTTVEDARVWRAAAVDPQSDPLTTMADGLRELMRDARHRNAEVLVCIPRSDVELRLMSLPNVPADELPDIVRMQAVREFSQVDDDWPLDFLTVDRDDEQVTVLAATLNPQRIAIYRQMLEGVELKPRVMALRATAAALVAHQTETSNVEIIVDDLSESAEIMVARHGVPVLMRTVAIPPLAPAPRADHLANEMKRTLVAARNQLQGDAVDRIVLLQRAPAASSAEPTSSLAEALQTRLQLPVRAVDPCAHLTWPTRAALAAPANDHFAAVSGLLLAHDQTNAPLIDFANPRRPAPKPSRRPQILAAITGVLLCGVVGFGILSWQLSNVDNEIVRLRQAIQRDKKLVEASTERLAQVDELRNWQQAGVPWIDQLQDISQSLPAADKVRITKWQANITEMNSGQIILDGVADKQATIGAVDQSLRKEKRTVRSEGGRLDRQYEGYPWSFKQTLTIDTGAKSNARNRVVNTRARTTAASPLDDGPSRQRGS